MQYREQPPPRALAPWVACTWERCDGGDAPVRVMPDGCIDIIWTAGAGAVVVGANTTAFLVDLPARTHVVGVRMRPGAEPPLLGVDGAALRDGRAPLHELWGDDGLLLAELLEDSPDRPGALLAALASRAAAAGAPDPLVQAAVARLGRDAVGVGELARRLFVSERQLRRRVGSAVGYGPKRLARVLRLERALAAARGGEELARVAAAAGYADQAHFAGDCRELAGVPPTALLGAFGGLTRVAGGVAGMLRSREAT
jgi:AraC-like DNA-binding protein